MDPYDGPDSLDDTHDDIPESETTSPSLESHAIPPGFKLVPETYIAVEPAMYQIMLNALKSPHSPAPARDQAPIHVQVNGPKQDEPKPFFLVRMLRQCHFGDIGYNAVTGQEIEYSPEGKYLKIDGETFNNLRSFQAIWKLQFGERRTADIVRNPFFKVVNIDSCPPIEESLGQTLPRQLTPDPRRLTRDEARGDATRPMGLGEREVYPGVYGVPQPSPADLEYDPHAREQVSRGVRTQRVQQNYGNPVSNPGQILQPQYPQQAMQQEIHQQGIPTMPPRAGIRGPDGLTERGRKIKEMSADQVERPIQRQTVQPIAGYDAPERVQDFEVEPGMVAGGQIVSHIGGQPADESIVLARQMDLQAQQLQSGRTRYSG